MGRIQGVGLQDIITNCRATVYANEPTMAALQHHPDDMDRPHYQVYTLDSS